MRKFLFKSILFLSPIFVLSFMLQPFIDDGLKQSNCSPNFIEWNDIFQSKINADLIIQGNSRVRNHISPKYLDSVLKLNSYNLGIDAYPFHMQYYRFLIYLQHNKKPKYIIQATDFSTLTRRTELFGYDQFIPFLDDKLIREAVIKYDGLDYRDFYIPLYKYLRNQELALAAFKAKKGHNIPYNGNYKGFQAVDRKWNTTFHTLIKKNPDGFVNEIDTTALRLFDTFIIYCLKEGIQLVFVNTPIYYEANKMHVNQHCIDSIYLSYSQKYKIPFLDYSNDSICLDTLNFFSGTHLNSIGVNKFNNQFAEDLKKIIH